jgi:CO/xanthine dehydrogenase Mo-binding subunit
VAKSGYGKKALPKGRAWGVALHESFGTVVAYVVEASVKDGVPQLHKVTAGVHCNLAVNPLTIEAQVQGAVLMAVGTTLPGAAITLKDGVVEQQNFSDYTVARMPDMPQVDGAHRAVDRAADRHGRTGPAAAGAGLRQRHLQADRQAAAQAAVRPGQTA